MPLILASPTSSFHQPPPSWLWSPAGCILETVLGPWGSSGGFFFSGCLPFSPFSCVSGPLLIFLSPIFLLLLLLYFLLSPFLLSFLHSLLLSSPSLLLSFLWLLLPFFSLLLFLPWLLLSPSVLRSPTCSSGHSFVSLSSFFAVFCRFLFPCLSSPPVFLLPPPVCGILSLPALFSCRLFLFFLSDSCLLRATVCRHLCALLSVTSFATSVLSLVPPPPNSLSSSLVPPVSYWSSLTSISSTFLAPFFPKDLQSSTFVSAGAGPSASDFFFFFFFSLASAGSTTFSFDPCLLPPLS